MTNLLEGIPIIIDNGSRSIKAGLATEDNPRSVFPSVIGRSKTNDKDNVCVKNTQTQRDMLALRYPIEFGSIWNWDDVETLWRHVYTDLGISSEDHPILLTDNPGTPSSYREKLAQIMFEEFNVPALYISYQAVLSMYSAGRVTGIIHNSGDGTSYTVPVYEGYAITRGISRPTPNTSGRDLTYYLMDHLNKNGESFVAADRFDLIDDIKRKCCFVSYDYKKDIAMGNKIESVSYKLPDGKMIKIDEVTRIKVPEIVFDPSINGIEELGIHESITNIIKRSDPTIQKQLCKNIVLAEGNTLFPGYKERLQCELEKIHEPSIKFSVKSNPYPGCAAWKGGVVLTSLDTFKNICITQHEYNDYGPTLVHRRCF